MPFILNVSLIRLKKAIRAQVQMQHPTTWLEAYEQALQAETILNAQSTPSSLNARAQPTQNTMSPEHTQRSNDYLQQKWQNDKGEAFVIIVMKNLLQVIDVKNKSYFTWM